MKKPVYSFYVDLDWTLVEQISLLDRYDAEWTAIQRRQGQHLKQLRSIETVRSVAASTRIEGSQMSNEEVDVFLENLDAHPLEERDEQEVAGYFEGLNLILESWQDMAVTESTIKQLHKIMLGHSEKDNWHLGDYKQQPNSVEATLADGSTQVIFNTTAPGVTTDKAMRAVVSWFGQERHIHPLVADAAFIYEILSVHPFQDGNGRLSRLLTTLILLKSGYSWIQYISFEHEIENQKAEYYRVLRACQADRPGEDITLWVMFFLGALSNMTRNLTIKLQDSGIEAELSGREASVLKLIGNRPHVQSAEVSSRLEIPLPTVKRMLSDLLEAGLIERHGKGRGTSYTRL